jgi:putative transposase
MRDAEAGADLCRRNGVSEATLYNWKSRYGSMDVSQLRRIKDL